MSSSLYFVLLLSSFVWLCGMIWELEHRHAAFETEKKFWSEE